MFRLTLLIFALSMGVSHAQVQNAPAPVQPAASAASVQETEHASLRKLKSDLAQVVSRQDFDGARPLLHEPFMVTVSTQESFNSLPQLKAYYDALFTRHVPRMKEISIRPEADDLSQIYSGTFAITRGSTDEHYALADGRSFDMKGRWTATSIRQPDGNWKLLAVHMGTNYLDNPVINAIERGVLWAGAGAGIIGLLLGFAAGWLLKRRRLARA